MLARKEKSAAFKPPWDRFLDGPDGGLFVDPSDIVRCYGNCGKDDLAAIDDPSLGDAQKDAAFDAFLACRGICERG